jgi:hypothetical protein
MIAFEMSTEKEEKENAPCCPPRKPILKMNMILEVN